jgi:hypothetical protein
VLSENAIKSIWYTITDIGMYRRVLPRKEIGARRNANMENKLFNSINWQDTENYPTIDDQEEAAETEETSFEEKLETMTSHD